MTQGRDDEDESAQQALSDETPFQCLKHFELESVLVRSAPGENPRMTNPNSRHSCDRLQFIAPSATQSQTWKEIGQSVYHNVSVLIFAKIMSKIPV
jgi:hypothetical protein